MPCQRRLKHRIRSPINESIERFSQDLFHAKYSILWEISTNEVFSASHKKKFPKDKSILWRAAVQNKFLYIKCLENDESYVPIVEFKFMKALTYIL